MSSAHEYQITVFSPEGKLHQVEYAIKAIKQTKLTSVAIRGREGVVLVSQRKKEDKMIEDECLTSMTSITPKIGCLYIGRESDARSWIQRLKQEAFEYLKDNGVSITAEELASRAADLAQTYTQRYSMRAYAAELVLCQFDPLTGPSLFKVDPAGHYYGYFGLTAGKNEQEAQNILEAEYNKNKGFESLDNQSIMKIAINILQQTIGQEFKCSDIEIGTVGFESDYRRLNDTEVQRILDEIQKFD